MDSLFYKGWTNKVANRLKLPKGLFLVCYLADLYAAIESMSGFKCFDGIMAKLAEVDEHFIPTVFEVEMAELLLGMFKEATDLEFAGCFKTKGEKRIDLRIKIQNQWVYFEMTKIMDYNGKIDTLRLYNLACSFLIGARTLCGKDLELQMDFDTIPDQRAVDYVINVLSDFLSQNLYTFTVVTNGIKFSLKEGTERTVKLRIKSDTISNKLKDKYFEELEHFDGANINVTVIDTTFLPDSPWELCNLTRRIFETEGDLSPISAVVLACKNHLIDEKDSFPIQAKWEMPVVFNDRCDKSEVLEGYFKFGKETGRV